MIEGTLVRLRAMEARDAEAQHRWLNDPEVTRHLSLRYPVALAAIEGRVAEPMSFANPRFTVERRDTGEAVGWAALQGVTPESRNGELDLVLCDPGLAADTAETLCRWAFRALGLHRVHVWAFAEDTDTIAAYEKAGFAREGVARDRVFKGGAWHDGVLLARLA